MNIFESLEELNVSEECFDDIIGLVKKLINENSVDDYHQEKLGKTKQKLAYAKALKRHLNKTIDKEANQEYRKAKGELRQANQDAHDDWQRAHNTAYMSRMGMPLDADTTGHEAEDFVNDEIQEKPDKIEPKVKAAKAKFSKQGQDTYKKVIDLKNQRDKIEDAIKARAMSTKKSEAPAKLSRGLGDGYRVINKARRQNS